MDRLLSRKFRIKTDRFLFFCFRFSLELLIGKELDYMRFYEVVEAVIEIPSRSQQAFSVYWVLSGIASRRRDWFCKNLNVDF